MTQELNLIDTIFYFVDTMAEYRQMLQENKVLSRTIVFVDETQEIYKDGKLFGAYKELVRRIDQLAQEVRDAMDQSENEVRELMRQLRESLWSSFEEEVQLITTNLQTYETRLADLRAEFEAGEIEEGNAFRDLDELKGILREYASWKTSVDQTLTTFSRIVDAQNATIRTFGERLDVAEDKVTNYEHLIDLKEQSLKEYIESYDIKNKVRDIIGREILLQDGLLHDYATRTDVDDKVRTSVDTWFNSLEPSWTQLTSKLAEHDTKITAMAGFDSRITNVEDGLDSMSATVTMFADWYDENKEFLAYFKASADDNSALFDIQAQFDANNGDNNLVKSVAARIFGYVNSEESNLVLQADHITMEGTDFRVAVDQVEGLGEWILGNVTVNKFEASDGTRNIKINALSESEPGGVYGIKSSTDGFYFKMDGSGWVANKNIEWDASGNLIIKGTPIDPTNNNGKDSTTVFENVYISNYWSKTEFQPSSYATKAQVTELGNIIGDLSDSSRSTLKDWVLGKIAEAALPEGQNLVIEQQVQTYLNNEIQRADGPFANFITSTELPGEISSALSNYVTTSDLGTTLDGYVTRQGLGSDVRGVIYDENTGELIADGPLYSSFAALETMSAALVEDDPITGEPTFVIGTIATQAINSKVENYITNDSALSTIRTWASTIDSDTNAGFVLESLVKKIKGDDSTVTDDTQIRAYISGIVTNEVSTITIDADRIIIGETDFSGSAASYIAGNTLDNYLEISSYSLLNPMENGDAWENANSILTIFIDGAYFNGYVHVNGGLFADALDAHNINLNENLVLGHTRSSISSIYWDNKRDVYGGAEEPILYRGQQSTTINITDIFTYELSLDGVILSNNNSNLDVSSGLLVNGDITANSIDLTNNLTLTGNTSKVTTPTLWVKGASSGNDPGAQFDAKAVFYNDVQFLNGYEVSINGDLSLNGSYTLSISSDYVVTIDSSTHIYVGGHTAYTGDVTISGKTIKVINGLIYNIV